MEQAEYFIDHPRQLAASAPRVLSSSLSLLPSFLCETLRSLRLSASPKPFTNLPQWNEMGVKSTVQLEKSSKKFGDTLTFYRNDSFYSKLICNFATDMSGKECIQRFSPNLFWDANPSELKMDESRGYIIQRVLEYGQMNDWLLINSYYGLDQIVEECKKMRTLNPVCLAFICTISHTKEEEYRCYHFRQSCPTPWNS